MAFSLKKMGQDDLAAAASDNLAIHMSWVQGRTTGMSVLRDEHLVLADSGLACDTFNTVCRARLTNLMLEERVATAVGYFRTVARPFSWWVGPGDRPARLEATLLAAGLEAAESELAMALDLASLDERWAAPPVMSIDRVRTREQARHFGAINAANWDPPDMDVLRFYEAAEPVLLVADSPLWLYVGYVGDRPVASAELTVGRGVVGLYGISTLAPYRGRGIGSAMVRRPLLDARSAGYGTAVLQAAPEAVGVYSRVGFVATGQYTEYKPRG